MKMKLLSVVILVITIIFSCSKKEKEPTPKPEASDTTNTTTDSDDEIFEYNNYIKVEGINDTEISEIKSYKCHTQFANGTPMMVLLFDTDEGEGKFDKISMNIYGNETGLYTYSYPSSKAGTFNGFYTNQDDEFERAAKLSTVDITRYDADTITLTANIKLSTKTVTLKLTDYYCN